MADRLFISHASEDAAVADRIVAYLEARGVACWIASRDIPPRAIYADAIVDGIEACSACIVLVSNAANASDAIKREVELASHEKKPFIPIRVDGAEPSRGLAYYLRNPQWVEYKREGERALDRIVAHMGSAAPAPRPQSYAPPPAPPPGNNNAPRLITLVAVAAVVLIGGGWAVWSSMGARNGASMETATTADASTSDTTSVRDTSTIDTVSVPDGESERARLQGIVGDWVASADSPYIAGWSYTFEPGGSFYLSPGGRRGVGTATGTWTQNGNQVYFGFGDGDRYRGTIVGDRIEGRVNDSRSFALTRRAMEQ
ncbi:toll/interleukin-1 receptor domain-containing protein [Terricaulis sp.]|uniref:toll/interleukin-1 receptor domain-containing protein n=1 Tax=Terricaulis sp. TaxID=2768686 RepID=UPI003782D389